MNRYEYDVIIVGSGPGGLCAAIYTARARLKTLIIEDKLKPGGQCTTIAELDNYPGMLKSSGPTLMEKVVEQARHFGAEIRRARAVSLTLSDDGLLKTVGLKDGTALKAKSVIIATGIRPRVLGIPGEKAFAGRGVSYCATSDADYYTDLDVVVVGSGNAALKESVFLSRYVNSLIMVVNHDEGHLDADPIVCEQAFACEKITFIWNSIVTAIVGDALVDAVEITHLKTGERSRMAIDGVFMFVGSVPQTRWLAPLKEVLPLTEAGYIEVSSQQETRLPGVFAAGDVCDKFLRQVITAAGEGASAAVAASQYLEHEAFWRRHVLDSSRKTLVLFWSPAVPQSNALMSRIERVLPLYPEWRFVPVDAFKNQRLAARYSVTALPTLVCLREGEEFRRHVQPDECVTDTFFGVSPDDRTDEKQLS